jgi:hypothetical protein
VIEGRSVLGDRFDDRLGAHEHAGFAEEVEAFDVDRTAVELGHHDREVLGLTLLIFLVGNEAILFFSKAKKFGHGVVKESLSDVLLVEGKVVLEMVAEGLFVLLVAFAGETLDQTAVGQSLRREAGQFRDRFASARHCDKMATTGQQAHGKVEAAQGADAASFNGEEFWVKAPVIDEDR